MAVMEYNAREAMGRLGAPASGLTKRPLGRILRDAGLVTEERLTAALEEQQRTNELLGDILVRLGAIERADLNIALSIQKDLASSEDAIRLAAGIRKNLGHLLLQARRITPEQLAVALAEQKRTGEKLGQAMVRLGMLRERELDATLRFQQLQEAGKSVSLRLTLGELLVSANVITREQLDEALRRQLSSGKRLGEVLVEAGYADQGVINKGLRLQEMLLGAVLAAAMALAPASAAADQGTASASLGNAKVTVSATVLARASMQVVRQPSQLVVTEADVRRGFVEADAASIIELKSNSQAGCLLTFESHSLPTKETVVRGLGRDVSIGPHGGMIAQRVQGDMTTVLSFRFILADGAQPGTYAWPLALSVSPM